MSRRKALVPGLALLLAWSAALLAASGAETAPAAGAKSPWRLFPRANVGAGAPALTLGWAESRVWVATPSPNDVPILRSARLAGDRLTNVEATRIPSDHPVLFPIVDGDLVLNLVVNGAMGADGYVTAPLLSNGRLGALKAVPDDLFARAQEAAPKVDTLAIQDGVRVGERIVWALAGGETIGIGGGKEYRLACCSTSGAAVDLTRFVGRRFGAWFPQIGRDGQGRIWLAWLDRSDYGHAFRGLATIFELDPSTLVPRSKPAAIPGVVAERIVLACAASCRLVAQSVGDVVSWAPGERAPTRVASHWERGKLGDHPMWLVAASYRSGHLAVAYHGVRGETLYDVMAPDTLRIVVGDARGARARVVASIPVANNWPPENPTAIPTGPTVYATFVPSGLVAFETFQYTRGNSSPLPYAFLPVRR